MIFFLKNIKLFFSFFFLFFSFSTIHSSGRPTYFPKNKNRTKVFFDRDLLAPVKGLMTMAGHLHKNIFHKDSVKIIGWSLPFYIEARILDKRLQDGFYDKQCHKNVNEPPEWCRVAASSAIAIPILSLASLSVLGRTQELRITGRVFTVGMPFVVFGKDIIKELRFANCLRPKNEHFKNAKYYGGFPSGHMAEATFMAVLFGLRRGPSFAIPLGAYAGFIASTFLACNRHYASQLVAGAALGTIYAVAANKLIESRLEKLKNKVAFGLHVDPHTGPAMSISYRF